MSQTVSRMGVDGCRRQAAGLREQAARVRDPAVKQQLLLLAADWDQLAEDAADLERRRAADAPTPEPGRAFTNRSH